MSRMIWITTTGEQRSQAAEALREAGAHAFTEIAASGLGASGLRLGSAAFPGGSAVLFSVVAESEAAPILARLSQLLATSDPPIRACSWPVEEVG